MAPGCWHQVQQAGRVSFAWFVPHKVSVLQPATLGTLVSQWAVWETCLFPVSALDLEMQFSGGNVLS